MAGIEPLIEELERSYADLQARLSDPAVYNDHREAAEVGRRLKELETPHKLAAADKHKPLGKYTILTTIAEKYTTNVGYPGYANAAVGDIFNQFLIPQMFAQVAQGKMTPENAARSMQSQFRGIYAKWKAQGLQ